MTVKERITAVYRGETVDRMPVAAYTRYIPRSYTERIARNAGLGIIDYVPVFSMLNPPWHMLDGYLSEMRGGEAGVAYRWEKGKRIERRRFSANGKALYADIERDAGGAGSEHILKRYVTSPEDYDALRRIVENSVSHDNTALFHERARDLGEDGVVLARLDRSPFQKLLIELVGPDQLFFDLADDPDTLEELMSLMEEKEYEIAERTFASDAEVIWLPDNITSEMTTPKLFNQYCLPYYRRLAALSYDTGKPLLVHFDGKVKALATLINSCGISAIDSLSLPEMSGDVTLPEARALFPGLGLLFNFPSNKSLDGEEEIIGWVRRFAQEAKQNMPCMLQLSEDVPTEHWAKVARALAVGTQEGAE